ncbi:multidrug efflux SMR transporter [Lentzea tibetensis]|uniref:Multidrug efflux SMR transporter n=1 Tax=Lentzea tibetensis TaxID=2591470 RepID=A0A563F348_9PSEU|nr:multidrug efflux SMR transporter [Lentzea tibetensis]TWP54181.1 multidrug efflux SMR transporter [Lentzea tibetensis]
MAWVVLIASGVLEAVWAAALAESRGFTRRGPAVLFLAALVLSMTGLAYAMNDLPAGTAYAVWVGVGATLTAVWAITTGKEKATVARVFLLLCLVCCVAGLKAVS